MIIEIKNEINIEILSKKNRLYLINDTVSP